MKLALAPAVSVVGKPETFSDFGAAGWTLIPASEPVSLGFAVSATEIDRVPEVTRDARNACVPALRAENVNGAGRDALGSLLVNWTVPA